MEETEDRLPPEWVTVVVCCGSAMLSDSGCRRVGEVRVVDPDRESVPSRSYPRRAPDGSCPSPAGSAERTSTRRWARGGRSRGRRRTGVSGKSTITQARPRGVKPVLLATVSWSGSAGLISQVGGGPGPKGGTGVRTGTKGGAGGGGGGRRRLKLSIEPADDEVEERAGGGWRCRGGIGNAGLEVVAHGEGHAAAETVRGVADGDAIAGRR